MTEQEWLECADPMPMLEFLRGKASDRKMRLFACLCYRRFHEYFVEDTDGAGLFAVERAEAFADDLATSADLADVREKVVAGLWDQCSSAVVRHEIADCATAVPLGDITSAAGAFVFWVESNVSEEQVGGEVRQEHAAQAGLLRDLFGNLFRPVIIAPAILQWNDRTIPKLAETIYRDRAFEGLPILADALEEAGCQDVDILAHCRGPGPHTRGCWAVDALMPCWASPGRQIGVAPICLPGRR
jgi:hypothetical protein